MLQVDFHHLRTPRWEYQQLSSTTHSSFPLFNQSVHLKRISLFWDFNPASELISETQGLEEGTDGGDIKATQLQPCSHNYTHKASTQPINHALIMPLGKLIFWGLGLGHVGQRVGAGSVNFQAFFSQIRTWKETSENDGQASIRLCLKTRDQQDINCEIWPFVYMHREIHTVWVLRGMQSVWHYNVNAEQQLCFTVFYRWFMNSVLFGRSSQQREPSTGTHMHYTLSQQFIS